MRFFAVLNYHPISKELEPAFSISSWRLLEPYHTDAGQRVYVHRFDSLLNK